MPLTDHAQHAVQLQNDLIRRMTPGRRLEIALSLYAAAWEIKAGWLRSRHPTWDEAEVFKATRSVFLTGYAGS